MSITITAGLFWAAFISATLLPAQSELALTGALLGTEVPASLAIIGAWTGNTAGSCLNWWLGTKCGHISKWINIEKIEKAERLYKKYGRWTLLASWLPIVGDPLTLAAGVLGEKFFIFLTLVALAKLSRYVGLYFIVLYFYS